MSHTRSICMIGLSIAIIAISSWITIPLGPIPFTLQMFAIPLAIYLLKPSEMIAAIYIYVFLGALGLPLFSGMRGGIGVLLGPTGGFLMGYLIGVPLASLLLFAVRVKKAGRRGASGTDSSSGKGDASGFDRSSGENSASGSSLSSEGSGYEGRTEARWITQIKSGGWELLAGVIFIFFAYAVGCIRYMEVANVDFALAFAACAAPFILPDLVKTVLAIITSQLIKTSLGERYW